MNSLKVYILLIIGVSLLSSCATIYGGAKYKASIQVNNANGAKIYYNNMRVGNNTQLLIKRKDADKINFLVEKEGYRPQQFSFQRKEFRGIALFFSILSGIGVQQNNVNGQTTTTYNFVPFVLIDLFNYSSLWKPDDDELGINKINYDHYKYYMNYDAIPLKTEKKPVVVEKEKVKEDNFKTMEEKLRDLKKMKDEEIIDDEEYKILKRRILEINDEELSQTKKEVKTTTVSTTEDDAKESTNGKITTDSTEKLTKTEKESVEEIKEDKPQSDEKLEEKVKTQTQEKEDKLSPEKQEKLDDLNRMLELGIISQKEYDEMKSKLIDNE